MKKIIASIMACVLLCSSVAFADFEEQTGVVQLHAGDEYKDGIQTGEDFEEIKYSEAAGSVFYSDMEDYSIVGILGALDIMGAAEGTLFKPNMYISRGQFVEGLLKLLRIDYSDASNLKSGEFYDVDKESPWYNVVYHALAADLITGYGDNSFRPDSVMTYSEAKSCMVRALGYDSKFGPYDRLAEELGLTDRIHVKNALAITRLEMATLFYNALETPTSELKLKTGDTIYTTTGKTILYNLWNIYRSEGQVTTSFVETIGTMRPEKNTVVINDKVRYDTKYSSDQYFIGCAVNYYYDEDDNLVYMYKNKKYDEIVIDSSDYVGYIDGTIRYYDGTRVRAIKPEIGYTLLYNGMIPTVSYTNADIFDIGNGSIRLISNDGGSSYGIVMIEEYRNYVAKSAYSSDNYIEILLDGGKIKLGINETHLTIFDENESEKEVYRTTEDGTETIDLSAISDTNVLSIFTEYGKLVNGYPSADTKYMKIIVSGKKLSGTLQSKDETELEMVIGDKSYEVSEFKDVSSGGTELNMASEMVGLTVNYLLDYKDRIVAVNDEVESDEWQYAYIMRVYKSSETENINEIQVYDMNTEVKRYVLDENLRINGYKIKPENIDVTLNKSAELVNRPTAAGTINKEYSQLVKIQVEEDKIVAMETLVQSSGKSTSYPETQLFRDEKYTYDANTKFSVAQDSGGIYTYSGSGEGMFRQPKVTLHVPFTDSKDADDYQISTISQQGDLTMDFFDVKNMCPEVAIRYKNTSTPLALGTAANKATGFWVMFDSKDYSLNEDEEVVMKFTVCRYNGIDEYYTKEQTVIDKLNLIEKGTPIKLYGIEKEVTDIEYPLYNGKPVGPSNLPWEHLDNGTNTTFMGSSGGSPGFFEVYDTYSASYFCVQRGAMNSDGRSRAKQILGYKRNIEWQKGGVLMYEGDGTVNGGRVAVGTVEQMKSAKQYGTDGCSVLFAFTHEGGSRMYIVYNLESNNAARASQ